MTDLFPLAQFQSIDAEVLNNALVAWGHRMGPLRRPQFGRQSAAHGLFVNQQLVAVVATEPLITAQTCGLTRADAVELARLCAADPHWCRVALRLWREIVFPAHCEAFGTSWAISYQDRAMHSGATYRLDGWVPIGRTSSGTDPRGERRGRKKAVWGWHPDPSTRAARRVASD